MIYQIEADDSCINALNISKWLLEFSNRILPERIRLEKYYDGENQIIKQGAVAGRPNYKINVNMAKYITDVATGYFIGKPVTYDALNENVKTILEKIEDINKNCSDEEVDYQVAGDMSVFGVGYQLVMVKDGVEPLEQRIVFKRLDPKRVFYVTDNTLLREPLCAVYYYTYKENRQVKNRAYVYDKENLYIFDGYGYALQLASEEPHNMGDIPILQSLNNDDAFGDYKAVDDLLDSLSLTLSNNTDDLQSIANAILAASGGTLDEQAVKLINEYRTANLPAGADMKWVIKDLNPEATRQHIEKLLDFIFQISLVPDLTDAQFAGNMSGVAMEFKMWGIDQLRTAKERKFKKTLYQRLKILLHLLQYRFKSNIELINDIKITFYKNLPENMTQDYEIAKNLAGIVSLRTLLSNISIVENVEEELKRIKQEKLEDVDPYGFNNNNNLSGGADYADDEE